MPSDGFAAELAAVINRRCSIRSYLPEPILPAEILDILTLVGRAPSAWNLQPWRFVAVVEPESKLALQKVAFNQSQVGAAPAVFVLYGDMVDALSRIEEALPPDAAMTVRDKIRAQILGYFQTLSPTERDAWGRCQTYIALGFLLLLLESRGYGSSPMLGFDPGGVKRLFDLPDHAEVAALIAFGRPAELGRTSKRSPVESLVRFA